MSLLPVGKVTLGPHESARVGEQAGEGTAGPPQLDGTMTHEEPPTPGLEPVVGRVTDSRLGGRGWALNSQLLREALTPERPPFFPGAGRV